MNPYDAYRANKIESGLLFQDFVVDVLLQTLGFAVVTYSSRAYQHTVGESRTGVEIKHDERFADTGNLWIEVAEKARPRPGEYVRSGIRRDDNTWLYVIGNYNILFLFPKLFLQALQESGRYPIRENLTRTSKGFLLPEHHARRYAACILEPNAECKVVKLVGNLESLGRALHEAALANPAQGSLFELFRNVLEE